MRIKIALVLCIGTIAVPVRPAATALLERGRAVLSALESGRRPGDSSGGIGSSGTYTGAELVEIAKHADLCPMVRKVFIMGNKHKGLLGFFASVEQLHLSGCVLDESLIAALSLMPLKTLTMHHCINVPSVIDRLPKTIEDLSIGWYGMPRAPADKLTLDLPRLRILWLTDWHDIDLRGGLPRALQVLYITSSKNVLLPAELPASLTRVTLSECELEVIPAAVLALPALTYLDVRGNRIPE